MENKNLWVVVETEEGKAKNVGYELLSVGRTLADKMGQQLVALVMGKMSSLSPRRALLTAPIRCCWWRAMSMRRTTPMPPPLPPFP